MTGKKWTQEEESELAALVDLGAKLDEITVKLEKTPGAVVLKCQRLGLPLKVEGYVQTEIPLPNELPSVEEALGMLAGALNAAVKPGLDRVEVQRLQAVAAIAKTYKELLCDYINYREIEAKLEEMQKQIEQHQKESQSPSPQPNPAPVA